MGEVSPQVTERVHAGRKSPSHLALLDASPIWDGALDMAAKLPGKLQSFRHARGSLFEGTVAQRLRGFQSAEHKKSFSEATWIFCMEPNSFGVTRGEQPLVRASRASKVAGAFLVLFWHAKENVPGGNALAKGMKL